MSASPPSLASPSQLIQTEQDVAHWLNTDGCRGYLGWITMLARTIEDTSFSSVKLTHNPAGPSDVSHPGPSSTQSSS